MFLDTDFHTVFIPVLVVTLLGLTGYYFWKVRDKKGLEKAVLIFKSNTFAVGFIAVFLWLMLPSVPSLSSFWFPETVSDIQSNEQLLGYLQEHNKAIVRIIEVIYWFLFVFVWWFLVAVFAFIKAFSEERGKEYFKNVKKKVSA